MMGLAGRLRNGGRWAVVGIILLLLLLGAISGCAYREWKQQQADNHLNLGMAYLESAQYHAAMKELLQAEKLMTSDARIHYYLGIAYHGKGLKEKAVAEFERALALKPDYSEASNYLGTLYLDMGLWDKAIESFNRSLSNLLYDTPAVALYNVGWAYYKKGDYQTAMEKYEEAIIKQPSSALIPLIEKAMGQASFARGDTEDAVRHFRRSLEMAPSLIESHFWLGECYGRQKNFAEAARSYETVIRMAPETELSLRAKRRLEALR